MRILGVDEIPEKWKGLLNTTGLVRYGLFIEELQQADIVSAVSSESAKRVIKTLDSKRGENFPYKDLKIGKPTLSHLKKLNRTGHMGVLVKNNQGVIQLLEGTLDNTLMPTDWSNADLSNITI